MRTRNKFVFKNSLKKNNCCACPSMAMFSGHKQETKRAFPAD